MRRNMMSDQRNQHRSDERKNAEAVSPSIQPIALQAFAVQIIDVFPVEIMAKRFPVAINNPHMPINAQFNIVEMGVDPENLQAQVTLEVKVVPDEDSHSFEILFKLVAIF